MTWYLTGDVSTVQAVPLERTACLDLETTGLNPEKDEVLQIAIVRGDGKVLMNELVKPVRKHVWRDAQRITGITPLMVEGCPTLSALSGLIQHTLNEIDLAVGYNLPFDEKFLEAGGVDMRQCLRFDVMREFAPVANELTGWGEYRWQPLSACARHFGISCTAHNALNDAQATLACFMAMLHPPTQSPGCSRACSEEGTGSLRTYLDVVAMRGKR